MCFLLTSEPLLGKVEPNVHLVYEDEDGVGVSTVRNRAYLRRAVNVRYRQDNGQLDSFLPIEDADRVFFALGEKTSAFLSRVAEPYVPYLVAEHKYFISKSV